MEVETIRRGKEIVLELASLLTLVQACAALLLIEFWGLRKIWKIITK